MYCKITTSTNWKSENDTYKKDKIIKTNFEHYNKDDVVNKAYLDTKISKTQGHLSLKEKDYNEFKLLNGKRFEEFSIEMVVKAIIQLLYDKRFSDKNDDADEVIKT